MQETQNDISEKKSKENPLFLSLFWQVHLNTNLYLNIYLKQFLCSWTIPLFKKGLKTELDVNDLFPLSATSKSAVLGDKLQRAWKKELLESKRPSLWRALIKAFGPRYMTMLLFWLLIEGLR